MSLLKPNFTPNMSQLNPNMSQLNPNFTPRDNSLKIDALLRVVETKGIPRSLEKKVLEYYNYLWDRWR